jgi:hypothetical protein
MGVPMVALPSEALVNGGSHEIRLSTGFVHRFLALYFKATYTVSDAVPVVHEDGWGAWIERIELLPSGVDIPFNMDGYAAMQKAFKAQGGPNLFTALNATQDTAMTSYLVLPIYSMLRDAGNPFNALFDPRGLSDYRIRITLRDLDDVITTTTETLITCQCGVHQYGIDSIPPTAGMVLEKREPTIIDVPPGAGVRTVSLKRGGAIRSIMVIARDDAPIAGSRSDAIVDTISVRRNTGDRRVDNFSWRVLRENAVMSKDYQAPVGVGFIDMDMEGTVAADAVLQAEGAGLEDLELEITTLASGHLQIIPEYVVQRGR